MNNKVAVVIALIFVAVCCFDTQAQQDEWSLRFLADVPAVENGYMPGGASMSPSGKTLAVFHCETDFFTLVRYDAKYGDRAFFS